MAVVTGQTNVSVTCNFTINEQEMRALDALAGYGDDAFIKMFYGQLGEAYLKPYESGLREFLKSIRVVVAPSIREIDDVRKLIVKQKEAKQ